MQIDHRSAPVWNMVGRALCTSLEPLRFSFDSRRQTHYISRSFRQRRNATGWCEFTICMQSCTLASCRPPNSRSGQSAANLPRLFENRVRIQSLKHSARVMIVDESEESREILRTLLERWGATAVEASQPEQALELAGRQRPDLIVLDTERGLTGEATQSLCLQAAQQSTPLVMLGSVPKGDISLLGGHFVAKPYHYGPLLRRIEELLAST